MRCSTDILDRADKEAAKAVAFSQNNLRSCIMVDYVVEKISLVHTALYEKFEKLWII